MQPLFLVIINHINNKKEVERRNKMSRYSGKCDVYDCLVDIHRYTEDELKNNVEIYVGDSTTPLVINSWKDLIPYYPYIIGSSSHDNVTKKAVVYIGRESFVDREERERLEFYLRQVLKVYNRCKRKKVPFDKEMALKEASMSNYNNEAIREIVDRVAINGKKASVDGIHLSIHEYYRRELVDEMMKNGLNPADYGYERFCN